MKKTAIIIGIVAASLPLASASASAAVTRSVAIENGSFENPPLADGQFCLGCTPGWSTSGGEAPAGANNLKDSLLVVTPDGSNVAFLNNWVAPSGPSSGALSQLLGEHIVAGTTYQLQFDVVRRADDYRFGNWVAELFAGDTVLASTTMPETEIALGGFKTLALDYTASAAFADQLLGIRFRAIYDPSDSSFRQVGIDNLRLTATASADAGVCL